MPFANDNAGTIKQRSARPHPALTALSYATSAAVAAAGVRGTPLQSPALGRRSVAAAAAAASHNSIGTFYDFLILFYFFYVSWPGCSCLFTSVSI